VGAKDFNCNSLITHVYEHSSLFLSADSTIYLLHFFLDFWSFIFDKTWRNGE